MEWMLCINVFLRRYLAWEHDSMTALATGSKMNKMTSILMIILLDYHFIPLVFLTRFGV